jgi:hypothetical protein
VDILYDFCLDLISFVLIKKYARWTEDDSQIRVPAPLHTGGEFVKIAGVNNPALRNTLFLWYNITSISIQVG